VAVPNAGVLLKNEDITTKEIYVRPTRKPLRKPILTIILGLISGFKIFDYLLQVQSSFTIGVPTPVISFDGM
jgi:hypothetical protein